MQRRPWAWVVRRLLDRRPWVGRDLGKRLADRRPWAGKRLADRRPWVGSRLAGPWVWSRRLVGPRRSCPGRLQREGTWASTTTPRVRPAPSPSSPQPLPSLAWVVSFKALNSMYEAPLWSHRNSKNKHCLPPSGCFLSLKISAALFVPCLSTILHQSEFCPFFTMAARL